MSICWIPLMQEPRSLKRDLQMSNDRMTLNLEEFIGARGMKWYKIRGYPKECLVVIKKWAPLIKTVHWGPWLCDPEKKVYLMISDNKSRQ
ncbi:unnamed protein product [Allacma fusca]|uniref:Uncharacterized protein n=1 Tax=Allacma fusca TaxID=39272 RepID=A0A8J2NQL2_9HEXA|nr:unnamed protein product [Allacma fusca]